MLFNMTLAQVGHKWGVDILTRYKALNFKEVCEGKNYLLVERSDDIVNLGGVSSYPVSFKTIVYHKTSDFWPRLKTCISRAGVKKVGKGSLYIGANPIWMENWSLRTGTPKDALSPYFYQSRPHRFSGIGSGFLCFRGGLWNLI